MIAASDKSKNAARGFLATKTLVKSIAKACAQQNVALADEDVTGNSSELVDALMDEYKEKYPSLTKKILIDGVVRYNSQNGIDIVGEEYTEDDTQQKFGLILPIIEWEMNEYYAKIEALKKSREKAVSSTHMTESGSQSTSNKRKSIDEDPDSPKRKPRGKYKKKEKEETPKDIVMKEILKKYAAQREINHRLANGQLQVIAEEAKKELGMEYVEIDLTKLDKVVRYQYSKMVATTGTGLKNSKDRDIFEEIYRRYSRAKIANGGKLQAGTINAIIQGAKLEYGMADIKVKNLRQKIQARFTKEHPEFDGNNPGQLKIGELTEEEQKRRQHLMNEITARYVRVKETTGKKKLVDGALDRIIEEVKNDLGIHEFDVPKASIRGRINRKSLHVQTLGKDSPYNLIDEPLVQTINGWLSQGISVTRAQGLNLANKLLAEKNQTKDSLGNDIVLDAKWWRNFLDRNKRKLVCAEN